MHDTTISSIKKLVLVCLVTIMKWLVILDADLPAVVSLMTSTPCTDLKFVKNFTRPDFDTKKFTH